MKTGLCGPCVPYLFVIDSVRMHQHERGYSFVVRKSWGSGMRTTSSLVFTLSCLLCVLVNSMGHASELTLERVCSDPDLNGPRLREIKISPDCSRVAFLRNRDGDSERFDLWVYSLAGNRTSLIVDCDSITGGAETLSDDEKARRERKRVFATGIVEYSWSVDGQALLFGLDGDIYRYDLTQPRGRAIRRLTQTPEFEADARFSPKGRYVSFIREQNIFIIDLTSGKERQLTFDGTGLIKNGVAEFIAQEEMDRYTGYWWSDDEKNIAFTQTNENLVDVMQRYEIYADTFKVVDERYPRTGTPNVIIKLGVMSVANGDLTWMDLGNNTDIYVARVDWLPDNKHVAIQRQSRDQKVLDLMFGDISTGQTRVVLTESSKTWINLHDDLTFFKKKSMFIWSSERTGYKHLYLYDLDGKLVRPLTAGNWVVRKLARVDEKNRRVYFEGFVKGPLEKHLYCTSLSTNAVGQTRQITSAEGWHDVEGGDKCEFFVDRFSNPDTPPQVSLRRMDGTVIAFLEANKLDGSHPYYPYVGSHSSPEFGTLTAVDGSLLYYSITKPVPFDPGKKYPAIVDVYGGPLFQIVMKSWGERKGLWVQYMAQHGYVVFALDNRGSGNRGKAFEDAIYRGLGNVEVEDQIEGTNFLKSLAYVDPNRIGIFGHSYGGYMALLSMMKAPRVFKAGVSASPVTDWLLYDTHYTERYLARPQENAEGYEKSSALKYIEGLDGELMIIHGMADDNVLFLNSCRLFKVLQDRGILFETMTYPGSKHSLSGKSVQTHFYKTVTKFFDEHL
ncbi:MAG: S9 family peptidase [Candidatus Eisenbacteria bacterium]|nr:S9 family peptidase [Candidatus Eisenbacteria bacterium]